MNKFRENLFVIGKHLDRTEDDSTWLMNDLFPDETNEFLSDYERVYRLSSEGDVATRRNRILSAMRQRGGLSKEYFEAIGNKLGDGSYTVTMAEGTDPLGFVIAIYSIYTSPQGPATPLPGILRDLPTGNNFYVITVTVTGAASADDLEVLFNRLKPAWTRFEYTYIP